MEAESEHEMDPTSAGLLLNDGLMSPKLVQLFGPMIAQSRGLVDEGSNLRRESTLHQERTGTKIIDASLLISKRSLPTSILKDLRETPILFGELLAKNNLKVVLSEKRIFRVYVENGKQRWGRRHNICLGDPSVVLCEVEELLVTSEILTGAMLT